MTNYSEEFNYKRSEELSEEEIRVIDECIDIDEEKIKLEKRISEINTKVWKILSESWISRNTYEAYAQWKKVSKDIDKILEKSSKQSIIFTEILNRLRRQFSSVIW